MSDGGYGGRFSAWKARAIVRPNAPSRRTATTQLFALPFGVGALSRPLPVQDEEAPQSYDGRETPRGAFSSYTRSTHSAAFPGARSLEAEVSLGVGGSPAPDEATSVAKRKREEADEGNACEAAVNEGMGSYDAEPRSLVSESFLILTSEDGGTITEHTHTAALYLPAADGEDDFEGFYEPPPMRRDTEAEE